LGTNPGETFDSAGGSGRKTVKASFPDSTDNRQIHSYEYVVDPAYRLYISVEDPEFHAALKHHLERGTSHYPPSLGLSELLASVETPDDGVEQPVEPVAIDQSPVAVESAIPESVETVVPSAGTAHYVERLPAAMEADGRHRRTTEFIDYAFTDDGPLETMAGDLALGNVEGRTVAFY